MASVTQVFASPDPKLLGFDMKRPQTMSAHAPATHTDACMHDGCAHAGRHTDVHTGHTHLHKQHARKQADDDGGQVFGVGGLPEHQQAHDGHGDLVQRAHQRVDGGGGLQEGVGEMDEIGCIRMLSVCWPQEHVTPTCDRNQRLEKEMAKPMMPLSDATCIESGTERSSGYGACDCAEGGKHQG